MFHLCNVCNLPLSAQKDSVGSPIWYCCSCDCTYERTSKYEEVVNKIKNFFDPGSTFAVLAFSLITGVVLLCNEASISYHKVKDLTCVYNRYFYADVINDTIEKEKSDYYELVLSCKRTSKRLGVPFIILEGSPENGMFRATTTEEVIKEQFVWSKERCLDLFNTTNGYLTLSSLRESTSYEQKGTNNE